MPGYELIGREEQEALNEIFRESNGVLFAHGFDSLRNGRYRVREFESEFGRSFGASNALAVSSGTAALKLALLGLGIREGDEVIIPSFTFIATFEAVVDVGAIPVVVDIDETLSISPACILEAVTDKTKAIIVVHMMGAAADILKIKSIAEEHGLALIEDNAQCCGGHVAGAYLGTIGDAGCFSFDFGKTITTGEGGMVLFKDEPSYVRARACHDHGHAYADSNRAQDPALCAGFNYRMTEMQAAVGLAQLKKLDYILEKQRGNKRRLRKLLEGSGLTYREIVSDAGDIGDSLVIMLSSIQKAESFYRGLCEHGIATKNLPDAFRWHFAGCWGHLTGQSLDTQGRTAWGKSEAILRRSVAIPVNVRMSESELHNRACAIRVIAESIE